MSSALLLDIGGIPECCTDHALEHIYKALSDEDGLAHDIWAEHESPFIRGLIEKFTERGLMRIASVRDELQGWIEGRFHVPALHPASAPPAFLGSWTREELDLARIYLQSLPPGALSLDDWSMVVDYLMQRYLPADALYEHAEWLVAKSHLMGRVQAHAATLELQAIGVLADAMPATVAQVAVTFKIADAAVAVLSYGKARACDAVSTVSDSLRHGLRRVVLDYEAKRLAGDPVSTGTLQQQLFDAFASANRDWRRIALTEAGEMANQGVVLSMVPGTRMKRMEMYRGACPWCRKIDGRIFRVTTPDDPDRDGDKDVWPGKTNVGRSSSPRKRIGNALVDRTAEELWWPASGVQHPHCRGRWEPMAAARLGDDPALAAWMEQRLGRKEGV